MDEINISINKRYLYWPPPDETNQMLNISPEEVTTQPDKVQLLNTTQRALLKKSKIITEDTLL